MNLACRLGAYRHTCLLSGLLTLAGCSSTYELRANADHASVLARNSAAQEQLQNPGNERALVVTESRLWFAGKSVPFDAGQLLPVQVRTVTLKTAGFHPLSTVAEWIEQLTRIPVRVTRDALRPASDFAVQSRLPAQSGERAPSTADSAGTAPSRLAAAAIEANGGPRLQRADALGPSLMVDYHGDLHGLLDQVTSRAGVQWTYRDGQIRFFRTVTRTIAIRGLPGNLTQSGGVQLSGGMSMTSELEMNIWPGIEKSMTQMVSRLGWFRVDSTLGNVVVHDAVENVEAVQSYLEGINRQLSRQVSLNIEVLQVTLNNRFERGIDWNYVRQVTGMGTLMVTGPSSVTTTASGLGFIRNNADGSTSNLMIRALESFGRVSTAYSSVINTMNRQPVPLGAVNTQAYLKQVAPSGGNNASGGLFFGPPALTPGEITTGFNITVLPVILDSNMVLLQCGVSISSLKEIASFTSGTGLAQQTVQQPSVSSFMTQQRMTVRSGDTIVLSGFEAESTGSRQADLLRDVVPGSRISTRDKTTLVLMITPRLLDF